MRRAETSVERDVALARVATVAEQMRRRAEAAEAEVERLREVLEAVRDTARDALYLFTGLESDDPRKGVVPAAEDA